MQREKSQIETVGKSRKRAREGGRKKIKDCTGEEEKEGESIKIGEST